METAYIWQITLGVSFVSFYLVRAILMGIRLCISTNSPYPTINNRSIWESREKTWWALTTPIMIAASNTSAILTYIWLTK